ncbi:MAG: hypothetical protein AB7G12_04845 [Thermoanaerobaculia bacterium]
MPPSIGPLRDPAVARRRGTLRRAVPLAAVALLSAFALAPGRALAQPPCPSLAPPPGPTIEVTSAEASDLRSIVAGAAAGTTILLHDGIYAMDAGDAVSRLVFATPGVTLRSFSGNREAVVLEGNYLTNELISIYASNITIADLTLREAFDHPIHVSGNPDPITGTLLHNLRIVDPGQQAIKINPIGEAWADYGTIECSSIELTDTGRPFIRDNCYTGGIDAHAAWGWLVRRNRISGFWCPAGLSEHAIHFWKASRDTVVEENVIVDCARGVGFGLLAVSGDRDYPDDPYPGSGYLGHIDGTIRNNFVAAADPGLLASQAGFDSGISLEQARDTRVVHNTVVSTAAPFSSIEWRFANTLVEIVNNLVSHNLRERDGNPQANLAGNLTAAPLAWFASPTTGDLHLVSDGVPPVDAGVSVAPGWADHDIDLQPRGTARDVGADELLDAIFADGFEAGDTGSWSLTVP